jgi:hypothetical protein
MPAEPRHSLEPGVFCCRRWPGGRPTFASAITHYHRRKPVSRSCSGWEALVPGCHGAQRPDMDGPGPEAESEARRAGKIAWAKMIRKVYEVDPLTCPECGAQMRVISLIEDLAVIERIFT